jgi:hypothetical protein
MISILMVTLNGFSLKLQILSKIIKLDSIFSIITKWIICIRWGWKWLSTQRGNLSRKTSVGIEEGRISNTTRTATARAAMTINLTSLCHGTILLSIKMTKFI